MTKTQKRSCSEEGLLSIVATPIGNLQDMTFRAVQCMKQADKILAEDTRRTKTLCNYFEISTPIQSFHAHSSEGVRKDIVETLLQGQHLVLVSDAGTPLLSDPGKELVREVRAENIAIESLPGSCAIVTALTVCGLIFQNFRFVGFLARSGKKRNEQLAQIADSLEATVFFESPKRLSKTLTDLGNFLPKDIEIAVCRELTKMHEEVIQGTPAEVIEQLGENIRGEITVVVSGKSQEEKASLDLSNLPEELRERFDELKTQNLSTKEAAKILARQFQISNRDAYQTVLSLQKSKIKNSD